MLDGIDVPAQVLRGGTNPTALIQAGNLEIGSENGGLLPFPGKIAQVAIYNAKVTQATILASMNQGLTGTETNLASAYSFSNSITDLNTTTPNDLTANGSAVATNADSPFGNSGVSTTLDYGIVMAKSFSTNTTLTVQVPEGCTIPTSGGVSSVDYSTQNVPYGFPRSKRRHRVTTLYKISLTQNSAVSGTWYNLGRIAAPLGSWKDKYSGSVYVSNSSQAPSIFTTLSTGASTESDTEMTVRPAYLAAVNNTVMGNAYRDGYIEPTTLTTYYLNVKTDAAGTPTLQFAPSSEATIIELENAYL